MLQYTRPMVRGCATVLVVQCERGDRLLLQTSRKSRQHVHLRCACCFGSDLFGVPTTVAKQQLYLLKRRSWRAIVATNLTTATNITRTTSKCANNIKHDCFLLNCVSLLQLDATVCVCQAQGHDSSGVLAKNGKHITTGVPGIHSVRQSVP
jgi:hypothetical protein